jgi:hypothetical protein
LQAIVSGLDKGVYVAANGAFKLRSDLLVFVAERPKPSSAQR